MPLHVFPGAIIRRYFILATVTTVGYGDHFPVSTLGQVREERTLFSSLSYNSSYKFSI